MKTARNRIVLTWDNVKFMPKSIKWDKIHFIMLKGMIMSEVLNVMNVCAPSNRAATFMKKDAIGHTKRNIQNTNPRGLHQISLSAVHVTEEKSCLHRAIFSSNFPGNLCFSMSWEDSVEDLGKWESLVNNLEISELLLIWETHWHKSTGRAGSGTCRVRC